MSDELEQAETHLHRAEADLQAARVAEGTALTELRSAEKSEDDALEETRTALKEIEEAAHHHEIHFTVDGEPHETDKHELTPDEIIRKFGERDPSTNYLVQIIGGQKESYQGKGHIPIKMHDGMRFQILCVGPMTVSDGSF